ncbi:uncharacterized protein CCOS01_02161 [Colletotrichum costaricense]|uniref:Uncharacterized protein n=1 Tax=Colletotrichum costaricense TaxID=1209916 RepID=A0AAI9Z7G0_9PEZI|nr:uncharacterized protein CCOS01_02161 [Colletotrichum costaricense]KAK1536841.1 hypothetical protein CCOS01_02161 [Colletotrichum costaricense]
MLLYSSLHYCRRAEYSVRGSEGDISISQQDGNGTEQQHHLWRTESRVKVFVRRSEENKPGPGVGKGDHKSAAAGWAAV